MQLGYNTNGLAHHDPQDALELLAEIGYQSVAITVDHHALNPFRPTLPAEVAKTRDSLRRLKLRSVVETGARFLLDPRIKHEPTLVTASAEARARRVDFLRRAIDLAVELESDCVSLWSGILRDQVSPERAFDRLVESLSAVVAYAEQRQVVLGFEPEPGMLIDTMARFEQLSRRVPAACLQLTLDVGHLHCLGEVPIADQIRRWGLRLVNVHIEDMRHGVHEHLQFGDGDMDFPPIFRALHEAGYAGGVHVELSRHSHDGPAAAAEAFRFLHPLAAS